VAPACANPSRLDFTEHPAPGWIVVYDAGHDPERLTAELAARHGFTPQYVYTAALSGFAAELSPAQVAAIRCEPAVDYVAQNGWVWGAGASKAQELAER
jgi:hypothetical protein